MSKIIFFSIVLTFLMFCGCEEKFTSSPANATKSLLEKNSLDDLIAQLPKDIKRQKLTIGLAEKLVEMPLSCVEKEYPAKSGHVYYKAEDIKTAKELTPAFYGCFDWHSSVHAHWTMVKLLKLFPNIKAKDRIISILDKNLSKEKIEKEVEFFKEKRNQTFERPYGWAWFLRLYVEIETFKDPRADIWRKNLLNLKNVISQKMVNYLSILSKPIRTGNHGNTAYSLVHMLDYASITRDVALGSSIAKNSWDFYIKGFNCPIHIEPSGEDFISPCLAEANLMSRILNEKEFKMWFVRFLPSLYLNDFSTFIDELEIKDYDDYRVVHLVGLEFERAFSMKHIARKFGKGQKEKIVFEKLADLHLKRGLSKLEKVGYGGKHWLASFAVYALTAD